MKTKPAEPIPTAFPTCGEVFHYLVSALDLPSWADALQDTSKEKPRSVESNKRVSEQLRDWATEAGDRVPSRGDFDTFIANQLHSLPRAADVQFVLVGLWLGILETHADLVRSNATYLDRDSTRRWYARQQAPTALYFLWAMQNLFRRVVQEPGPVLQAPLSDLLILAWPEDSQGKTPPKHPLHQRCFKHYATAVDTSASKVDARTVDAWKSGEDRPSCGTLGRHFEKCADKLGLVLNFAFAGLLEALVRSLLVATPAVLQSECRRCLLGQARCLHALDESVAGALARISGMSLEDFERLLAEVVGNYMQWLATLPDSGLEALDLRVARFRCYRDYGVLIGAVAEPPANFNHFVASLQDMWAVTQQNLHASSSEVFDPGKLTKIRTAYPGLSEIFAGPLLAIEARCALLHPTPSHASLQAALSRYQEALDKSRYQAGTYTSTILREALGLAALLHRHEMGEGTMKPWMKKILDWWDLLGFGAAFKHEQLDQRIELAESGFSDSLNESLRERLRTALPQLGLRHWRIGGFFGITTSESVQSLEPTPIHRRQKRTIPGYKTVVFRDQSPLMEAIDRDQLEYAHELVRGAADLNFVNSTGDTCITKGFAAKDYDLVLKILRRDTDPIRIETVLRVTEQMGVNGLEQAISHGQVEILRELAEPKPGRRGDVNMNTERIWGRTPLYYAVSLLAHCRMSDREAFALKVRALPPKLASSISLETFSAVRRHLGQGDNQTAVMACIKYLACDLRVDLDTPNANENSALTYAAERRLHDVAAILLAASANVNHRFLGGGTALMRAILNDDLEMAKLLIEYRADCDLYVEGLRQTIRSMPMSEKLRRLFPSRPPGR